MSAKVIKAKSQNLTFIPLALHGAEQKNALDSGHSGGAKAVRFQKLKKNPSSAVENNTEPQHDLHVNQSEQKRKTIDNAHEEAEKIIETAKARAEEIEREAFARGEAEGRASVSTEIGNQVVDLREQFSRTLSELQSLKTEIESKAEREMVELAIEIAKKIVQREVTVDREVALTLARVALTRLHSRSTTIIRLHPEDYAYATAHRERLESDGAVEIVEDRSVGLGGCLIQTDMGEVDARIVQQFREIEKGFWGELPY